MGEISLRQATAIIEAARTPEADGVVAQWMQRHDCRAALVRPDHYVFGTARDAATTQQLLQEWRERFPSPRPRST